MSKSSPASLNDSLVVPCDVTNQADVDAAFAAVAEKYGRLDFVDPLDRFRT